MSKPKALSRRKLLRTSVESLLAAALWPGILSAQGKSVEDDFYFLVVNDTHYLNRRCSDWLDKVIGQMKAHRQKIDFCLHLGDLGEDGNAIQIRSVREHFKQLQVPVHTVIGNHDYVSQADRSLFEVFITSDLNYHFEHMGWQFIGLDTTEGQNSRNTSISSSTLRWLDIRLPKLDKLRPTVLFTHFPMGPLVPGRPKNATDLLARFKEFNLRAVFNGHFHGSSERKLGNAVMTTNKCCAISREKNHDGTTEKGYFLCHARDGKIERTFVEVKTT